MNLQRHIPQYHQSFQMEEWTSARQNGLTYRLNLIFAILSRFVFGIILETGSSMLTDFLANSLVKSSFFGNTDETKRFDTTNSPAK